jgi:hypothetical protein
MTSRLLAIIAVLALALAACGTGEEATTEEPGDAGTDVGTETDDLGTETDDLDTETDDLGTETDDADVDAGTDDAVDAAGAEGVAQAVETTLAEGSAAFDVTIDISTEEVTDTLTSSGVVDFEGATSEIEVLSPAGPVQTLATPQGLLISLGDTGAWARVDPTQLQGVPAQGIGLATAPLQDPTVSLQLLRGATDDVEQLGTDTVDGEELQQWRVVVDVEAAAQQADPQAQRAVGDAAQQAGGDTIELLVWTDDGDRIRRISQTVDLAASPLTEGQPEGTVEITTDLHDFGASVDIEQPQEGEIIDIDEQMLERLLTGAET